MQQNMPVQSNSWYEKWYPISRYELYKMLAVLIAMGIDRCLNLADYWSMDTYKYTSWFHKQFSRNWFQIIYSTMLLAGFVNGDDQKKKR